MISFNADSIAILVLLHYIFGSRTQKKPGLQSIWLDAFSILSWYIINMVILMIISIRKKIEGKEAREMGWIPESGRYPGGEHGNPLQYSWLENLMDREAWKATVQRVTKGQIWQKRLSTHAHTGPYRRKIGFCLYLFSCSKHAFMKSVANGESLLQRK